MQTTPPATYPLLTVNATSQLICYRLGSKLGEIVEQLYFFFKEDISFWCVYTSA